MWYWWDIEIFYSLPSPSQQSKWMDGWSGPSRGQMPAGARDNLLPRQCLVYNRDMLIVNISNSS